MHTSDEIKANVLKAYDGAKCKFNEFLTIVAVTNNTAESIAMNKVGRCPMYENVT